MRATVHEYTVTCPVSEDQAERLEADWAIAPTSCAEQKVGACEPRFDYPIAYVQGFGVDDAILVFVDCLTKM
jgi:hypothetical protein